MRKCNWCHKQFEETVQGIGAYCSDYCRMKKNGANRDMVVTQEIKEKRKEYQKNYYLSVLKKKRATITKESK